MKPWVGKLSQGEFCRCPTENSYERRLSDGTVLVEYVRECGIVVTRRKSDNSIVEVYYPPAKLKLVDAPRLGQAWIPWPSVADPVGQQYEDFLDYWLDWQESGSPRRDKLRKFILKVYRNLQDD